MTTRLSARQLNKVAAIDLPLVALDPANALPPHIASIGATNWSEGVDATQHLLDLGHRRIAFIRGTTGSVPSNERLQGYLSALGMRGMAPDTRLIVGDDFSHAAGKRAADDLLALPEKIRPTAIFASSDSLALGVYESAHEHGFSIPQDLSVVGFDDSMIAEITTPGLTTVRQPLEDMGGAAVRYLVDVRKGRPTTSGPLRLATQLVTRASTAPPPTQ
ncbi:substrate-binding domain-containing protein [Tessaracoccus sp.]